MNELSQELARELLSLRPKTDSSPLDGVGNMMIIIDVPSQIQNPSTTFIANYLLTGPRAHYLLNDQQMSQFNSLITTAKLKWQELYMPSKVEVGLWREVMNHAATI